MSAAGRGGPRMAHDTYPTPAWATRRILEALWPGPDMTRSLPYASVVEPCAGEGAIVRAVEAFSDAVQVCAFDIRGPLLNGRVSYADATQPLPQTVRGVFDLLITNPPFNLAHEIIQAQRNTARLQAYLLRSSFIAGERAEAYRYDMPDEYRLPERPEFIRSMKCKRRLADGRRIDGCGWSEKIAMSEPMFAACPSCGSTELQSSTTDSTPYSWFVWRAGLCRRTGSTNILPSTPLEERKALAA
jgi:hypothetical protein